MTDRRGALFCQSCGQRLSGWLLPIRDPDEMRRLGRFGRTEHVTRPECPVPPGRALIVSGAVRATLEADHGRCLTEGSIWLHLSDLRRDLGYVPGKGLIGCCGLGWEEVPNRACRCGAEAGIERSECFTWHYFETLPETTEWRT